MNYNLNITIFNYINKLNQSYNFILFFFKIFYAIKIT